MNNLAELCHYCEKIGCEHLIDEPMSAHTSFKIGGAADVFLRPADENTAALVLRKMHLLGVPLTIIGRGSDLLVSDAGIRGAVLSLDERTAMPQLTGDCEITCPAGAPLSALADFAQKNSLSGLEFSWGIPGSVGGAVYMNAGAYGGEMRDVLFSADYLDENGGRHTLSADQLELGYRHSFFTEHDEYLIVSAVCRLKRGDPAQIRAKMDDLMERRCGKQPLEYPSAGSTFKRPEGAYASALIDGCGLKGLRVGGAMVSKKHAGFLINYDNATCNDVLGLIEAVKREVREKTGHNLECEIKLL